MDNQTLFDVKNAVEVMSKALKLFAEKITELMNLYHINQDTINEYLKAFGNLILWRNAVNRLSENQIVFTEQLSGDMIEKVNKSTNVDETILEYYTENEEKCLRNLVERCGTAERVIAYKKLYPQIVIAAKMGCFQLACLGLFSLEDGVLSDIVNQQKNTSFKKRMREIEDKINNKIPPSQTDLKVFAVMISIGAFQETAFGNSDFDKPEPSYLNRHWTLHGRSHRDFIAQYDILFLDIDLGKESGIDLARKMRKMNPEAVLIFVTNFSEYAPEGYEVDAFRYLAKSELEKKLPTYFEDALAMCRTRQRKVEILCEGESVPIPVQSLAWIESQGREQYLHLVGGCREQLITRLTITQLEDLLVPHGFLRIHKSYLVNMAYLQSFQSTSAVLTIGQALPVGARSYRDNKQKFVRWQAQQLW